MFFNILKFCVLLSIFNRTHGCRITDISTSVSDVQDDNIKIEPFVKVGRKYYYFAEKNVTWFKAHLDCRNIDGYLASVEGVAEFQEISKYMTANYATEIWWWVSGADLHSHGNFFWYRSGKPITYGWTSDQPDNASGNEHCVHLWYQNNKFEMNDLHCYHEAYYVCEADKPKTVQLSLF